MKIKVIVLGDKAVGKTNLVNHLRATDTRNMYIPTIGVDLVTYTKSGTMLQVWDTSGSSKFQVVVRSFLRGISLCVLVYNSSRSLTIALKYLSTIDCLCERDYRVVIVCLTADMDTIDVGRAAAERNGIPFFQCNAFYRADAIHFWHDVINLCESYVEKDGWKVDHYFPQVVHHRPSTIWDKLCFWR